MRKISTAVIVRAGLAVVLTLSATAGIAARPQPIDPSTPEEVVAADVVAQNANDWETFLKLRTDVRDAPESVSNYKALWREGGHGIRGNVTSARLESIKAVPFDVARQLIGPSRYADDFARPKAFYVIIDYTVRNEDAYIRNGPNFRLYVLDYADDGWRVMQVSKPRLRSLVEQGFGTGSSMEQELLDRERSHAGQFVDSNGQAILSVSPLTTGDHQVPSTIVVMHATPWPSCIGIPPAVTIDFTTYVKDVLPNEWSPSWPSEALKAGALAVKMYGWYFVKDTNRFSNFGYDVKDQNCDQNYIAGSSQRPGNASTNNAVDAVAGQGFDRAGSLFEDHYLLNSINDPGGGYDAYGNLGGTMYEKGTHYLADNNFPYDEIVHYYYDTVDQEISFFNYCEVGTGCSGAANFFGTVTDKSTGHTIANASVTWGTSSTMTDGFGVYSFSFVPCQTATLTVSSSGYLTSTQPYAPQCNSSNVPVNVALTPNGGICSAGLAGGASAMASCSCTGFTINPSSTNPTSGPGSQPVTITAVPAGCLGLNWNASGNGSWLTVSPSNGTGSGSATVSWSQNPLTTLRSGIASIAGNTFTVSQAGIGAQTCSSYTISPSSESPSTSAGSRLVTVTGVPAGCTVGGWGASGNGSWLTASVNGSNSATVAWATNPGSARTATADIAGNTFTVNQAGTGTQTCTSYTINPTTANPSSAPGSQTVTISGVPNGCTFGSWSMGANDPWLNALTNVPPPWVGSTTVTVFWTANGGAARGGTVGIAGNTFTVNQASGTTQTCTSYTINPTSTNPTSSAGSQTVTMTGAPGGCAFGSWSIGWDVWWLNATMNGSGPFVGSAPVTVSWNANGGAPRTGTVAIAGNTFIVNQAGVATCTSYSISPTSVNPNASAGGQTVTVIGIPAGCGFGSWGTGWNDSWLAAVINGSGPFIGSTTVSVSWTANAGAPRSGIVSIADNNFTVNQAGSSSQFVQQGPKLVGTGAMGPAQQGGSVSLSTDGNTAIVGAWGDNNNDGEAWIWMRSGATWTQQTRLFASAVGNAHQGESVALSGDGRTAIVGGEGDSGYAGAAWIWTLSGGAWTQQAKLVGSGALGSAFQGNAVALSADGNTAIVGGYFDNYTGGGLGDGAAWVWTRSGGVWTQQAKLVGSGALGNAAQGYSVALAGDGNTAIVGGWGDGGYRGAAWLWTRSGAVWTQQAKLVGSGDVGNAEQGRSVALSGDGNVAIVGGYFDNNGLGAGWVWNSRGGVWTLSAKLVGSGAVGSAFQGWSASLSNDGNRALLGGIADNSMAGAAWVWTKSAGVWTEQGGKLVGSGAIGNAYQGFSVSLSGDGSTAIVGGSNDNGLGGTAWIGAAWIFVSPEWVPAPPTPTGVTAVAITNTRVDLTWSTVAGATYQIDRRGAGGTFSQIGTSPTNSFSDTTASADSAYLYRVRAVNTGGTSASSAADLATTVIFVDNPLTAGTLVKAVHLSQLRTAVNAVRLLAGLPSGSFTGAATPGTVIGAVHITELRTALDAARGALGLSTGGYSDVSLTGVSIKAVHSQELRDRVK